MLRRFLPWLLGLLIACLTAAGFWVGGDLRDAQAAEDDRAAVLWAAGTHALNLLSVSHRTVDADIARVLASSTGSARAEYARNAAALKQATTGEKVVQTGALRAAGLVSMGEDTARVLVAGDAVIRWEGRGGSPQERFYRWSMEVTRAGGTWLVSKAELVP
ncbi:hypothetical protein GCM10010156_71300 [Planobispora rosea]|uniref:Mce-associated membrane protein n=1 Tax=Planobispora rosea TaxID=35762 RepID=A0A8J3WF17_PLARO|nr:hypothetical protein [Planobispora rosea]GGT03096.1 hypothetical protein GCM10010156_71300 [Planobispora rosea]GIH86868.1 hypothetical protein Pro02_52760 [Planobispora rosea]